MSYGKIRRRGSTKQEIINILHLKQAQISLKNAVNKLSINVVTKGLEMARNGMTGDFYA